MNTFTKCSDSSIRANLRAWRSRADSQDIKEGLSWYRDAHEFTKEVSEETGVDQLTAAGVLSALSPANKWERNKFDAMNLCKAWSLGKSPDSVRCCTYNANKRKAWAILEGDKEAFERSPKTWAFAHTIATRSENCVVIDRWHARACLSRSKRRKEVQEALTAKQYDRIERLTIEEAGKQGEVPYVFQAIIWVTIKRSWES